MKAKKTLPAVGEAMGALPELTCVPDTATYFYIKHIKQWMECPVCGEKMRFESTVDAWRCATCGFDLPEKEFLDGYVFWFCDECEAFLNVQDGFGQHGNTWACAECGHLNGMTESDLVGTCQDCGCLIENPDATVCPDCEAKRLSREERVPPEAS